MNVLSCFDGMGCCAEALYRAGMMITSYGACEINPHAIKIAQKNHPYIIQLGDITTIHHTHVSGFNIDLIAGGSPCQSFSGVGDGSGFDGKSKLFWEFARLRKESSAKFFLLENVRMKKEWMDIITKELGVEPICINSALVSGQNRERLYWTNIPGITQPADKGIRLVDILEPEVDDKYYHSEAALNYMNREVKGGRNHWDFAHHSDTNRAKSACISANFRKGVPYNVLIDRRVAQINPHSGCSTNQPKMQHRIFNTSGVSPALTSFAGRTSIYPDPHDLIRRLTPVECERLQTLPDNYTAGVSDTHRYEMIGNGWTINVLAHIFRKMNG